MNFRIGKEEKNIAFRNEEIKNFLENSRKNLQKIITSVENDAERENVIILCSRIYDLNENISADERKISEELKSKIIEITGKIEKYGNNRTRTADSKTKDMIDDIVTQSLKIRKCIQTEAASAAG